MQRFRKGDVVIFTDKRYADTESKEYFLNKEGFVVDIEVYHRNGDALITVQYPDGRFFSAFEKRFSHAKRDIKSLIECKVNYLYTRQPYYKFVIGKDHDKLCL